MASYPSLRLPIVLALLITMQGGGAPAAEPVGNAKGKRGIHLEPGDRTNRDSGKKWAIVVGVNKYLDPAIPNLNYCVADAQLVARTLIKKCGYDRKRILILTDDQPKDHLRPFRINLRNQIEGWLRHAESDDTVLVFYSGHGFLDARGQGFLAPRDCEKNDLGQSGYRTDNLRDVLLQCKATQKLLILDCCHAGGRKSGKQVGASSQELGSVFTKAEGLITLASCRKNEESLEWKNKRQGLFTYYLTQGLGGLADYDKNNVIDSDELYRFTVNHVPITAQREMNGRQTPVRLIGEDVVGVFDMARLATSSQPSLAIRPTPPPGLLTLRFTIHEKSPLGKLLSGATVELLYRRSPGAKEAQITRSNASGSSGQCRVTLPGYWSGVEGQFTALVRKSGKQKRFSLDGFPEERSWDFYCPTELPKEIMNSLGMKLNLIPAGSFQMGNADSAEETTKKFKKYGAVAGFFEDEQPRHRVRITQPYYLGQHEVTVGQFRRFVSDTGYETEAEKGDGSYSWNAEKGFFEKNVDHNWRNPGFRQRDDHPVVSVSWNDATAFAKWLSKQEGVSYRLPTEAQWEYACRAGTRTQFYHGDDPEGLARVGNVADGTAKAKFSSWKTIDAKDGYVLTAPVGQFRKNAFGVYDMHGNVWEWCQDRFDSDYYENSPSTDPTGPTGGSYRVIRGGSWNNFLYNVRAANRGRQAPEDRCGHVGFRLLRVVR